MRKLLILAGFLLLAPVVRAATLYVNCNSTSGGTGTTLAATGANRALADLPSSLVRGDTYYVAGDPTCTYAAHTFDDTESGVMLINVLKVTVAQSGVTGYASTMSSNQAQWTKPVNSDFQLSTTWLWHICRSYYNIDGITGTPDPASGGPTAYGFLVASANFYASGMVAINTNSCGAGNGVQLTNITIAHTELSGVNNYQSATIQGGSCSYSGGTTTVTLSPTPSWTLTVGDAVEADTALAGGTAIAGSTNAPVKDVSSWPTVSFTSSSSPCATMAVLGNDFGGTALLYVLGLGTTNTYGTIVVSTNYLHDCGGTPFVTAGINGLTFEYNYLARNRYTPSQHANGWDDHVQQFVSFTAVTTNANVFYNWFQDIVGTAYIAIFNSGSGGNFSSVGTVTGWNIYGNVMWSTSPSTQNASQWVTCFGTTGVQPVACSNFNIFNNTVYNLSSNANGTNSRVEWGSSDPSSTNIQVYDNLFVRANNVAPAVSAGSVCTNQAGACASTAQMVSDYNCYDTNNTGSTVTETHNGCAPNVTLATFFLGYSSGNFGLAAHTANLFDTHVLLPGNDVDGHGNNRCFGVSCPGTSTNWDGGAFALASAAGSGITPGAGVTTGGKITP